MSPNVDVMLCIVLHNDPIVLDDCQFHECADLSQFEMDRSISLAPAPGEFALMNYRCTAGIRPPFRVMTSIEQDPLSPFKVSTECPMMVEYHSV